jgi:hypothetical protein
MNGVATLKDGTAVAADRTYKTCTVQDLLSLKGNTTVITGVFYLDPVFMGLGC